MNRLYSQMSQLGQHNAELVLKNIDANTKMADLGARQRALQLGSSCLGLPCLLLRCRPLDVPLTSHPSQLLLQRPLMRSQIGHFCVGIDVFEHQLGVVLPSWPIWEYSRFISALFSRENSLSCCKGGRRG